MVISKFNLTCRQRSFAFSDCIAIIDDIISDPPVTTDYQMCSIYQTIDYIKRDSIQVTLPLMTMSWFVIENSNAQATPNAKWWKEESKQTRP